MKKNLTSFNVIVLTSHALQLSLTALGLASWPASAISSTTSNPEQVTTTGKILVNHESETGSVGKAYQTGVCGQAGGASLATCQTAKEVQG